jgi:hypothetical protein
MRIDIDVPTRGSQQPSPSLFRNGASSFNLI